jgi:hypothetical protein
VAARKAPRTPKPFNKQMAEAACYIGQGDSAKQASEKIGVCYETVWAWMKREDFQAAVREETDKIIRSLRGKAIKVVNQHLDHENPWIQQAALAHALREADKADGVQQQGIIVSFTNSMPPPALPDQTADILNGLPDSTLDSP